MAFWRLFYHIIWTTKKRIPLITPNVEQALYGYLVKKAEDLGAYVHAVDGISEHVHFVVSIPPRISIADFVGQLKGGSAYHVNHLQNAPKVPIEWQRGYGILSFGEKHLN